MSFERVFIPHKDAAKEIYLLQKEILNKNSKLKNLFPIFPLWGFFEQSPLDLKEIKKTKNHSCKITQIIQKENKILLSGFLNLNEDIYNFNIPVCILNSDSKINLSEYEDFILKIQRQCKVFKLADAEIKKDGNSCTWQVKCQLWIKEAV